MTTVWKVCGVAILGAVAYGLLKSSKSDPLPLQWTGMVLMSLAYLAMLSPVIEWVGALCHSAQMGEAAGLLLRGLGVAMLTQWCADFCRQSGDGTWAAGVENIGRAELLLLSLPELEKLVSLAASLLENQ